MKKQTIKNKKLDQRIFRQTAIKSKSINVSIPMFRGGIRL